MGSWLLTWNPAVWAWTEHAADAARVSEGSTEPIRWSTGNTKKVSVGDRAFLLRQGSDPKGIVGSAWAVSDSLVARHHDPARAARGETMNAAMFRFDHIVDFAHEKPLPVSTFTGTVAASVNWNTPASGITVAPDASRVIDEQWRRHVGLTSSARFSVGSYYTREEVQVALGLTPQSGGNWFTGHHQHNREWFLFPNVGVAGRTGHDYGNAWEGDDLVWYGKTNSRKDHDTVRSYLADDAIVHLFSRNTDRGPFEYHGLVRGELIGDESPVKVIWRKQAGTAPTSAAMPNELPSPESVFEGAKKQITVNAYERDRGARNKCVAHWTARCSVCSMTFAEVYRGLGEGYIHVHHLRPIASIGREYQLNPIDDLRPVCPNCHAVLHFSNPPLSIEQLRTRLGLEARLCEH